MLTLSPKARPPSSSASGSSEKSQESQESQKRVRVIPPGQPYLTKINGKLVMARNKKPRSSSKFKAVNLLGEAFGKGEAWGPPRVVRTHKRSASAAPSTNTPLIIGGIPYVPQQSVIQPQPVTHSLPFQQNYPYYGVVPMLQQQQPQPQPQHQFTYPATQPGGPTHKDFETLRQIDGHYNLQKHSSDPALKAKAEPVPTSRTTITITKHICAQCGRLRSRQYHRDNPIKPGIEPAPAFCRKCQRDASATSCSDKSPNACNKKGSKKKEKKKDQKKRDSSSNEDEGSGSPEPKGRKGSYVRLRPPVEVVVEEEPRQSRGRRRQRDFDEEAKAYGRPLSPIINQSDSAYKRYEPREGRRVFTEPARQRSPSPITYRYVEAPRYHEFPARTERPSRFESEDYEPAYEIPVREKRRNVSRTFDNYNLSRNMSRTRYTDERIPRKENSFEDLQSSSRSYGSSQRPRERLAEQAYEYQPKGQRRAEREADRRREKIDRATFDARSGTRTFAAQQEAGNYYNNDWDAPEPEPELRRQSTRTGYRRDRYEDSELGASEATYDPMTDPYNMPRAPTPPHTNENWQQQAPPYPFSSDSDIRRDRKGKAPQRFPSPEQFRPRSRNPSKATERALVPSPVRRSGNQGGGKGHERRVSWGEPEYHGWEDAYNNEGWREEEGGGSGGGRPEDTFSRISGEFPDFGPGDPSMWGVPGDHGASF